MKLSYHKLKEHHENVHESELSETISEGESSSDSEVLCEINILYISNY